MNLRKTDMEWSTLRFILETELYLKEKTIQASGKRWNHLGIKESGWYFHCNIQRKVANKFLKPQGKELWTKIL